MASYYSATDDPQPGHKAGLTVRMHEETFQQYGPPPPNYTVEKVYRWEFPETVKAKQVWKLRYMEASSTAWSFDHPLSSMAKSSVFQNEKLLVKQRAHGVFDVPFTYKTGELSWHYSSSAFGALARAMDRVGMKNRTGDTITEANLQDLYGTISQQVKDDRQNSVLYHPTNRDTIVWPDEPALSIVASRLDRSLIILCPLVAANGTGAMRMYDRTNRPPIYARWSTGRQSLKPPLILGCLPKMPTEEEPRIKCMWFSVWPNKARAPTWGRPLFVGENVQDLARRVGFPISPNGNDYMLLWALVSLQRRIVIGAVPADTNLGCWLWQFGKHLGENCKGLPAPTPFNYDANEDRAYRKKFPNGYLSLQTLSCLVLCSRMTVKGHSTREYAALWDEAIDAQIVYKLDQTDQNWDDFVKKMKAARRIPIREK